MQTQTHTGTRKNQGASTKNGHFMRCASFRMQVGDNVCDAADATIVVRLIKKKQSSKITNLNIEKIDVKKYFVLSCFWCLCALVNASLAGELQWLHVSREILISLNVELMLSQTYTTPESGRERKGNNQIEPMFDLLLNQTLNSYLVVFYCHFILLIYFRIFFCVRIEHNLLTI